MTERNGLFDAAKAARRLEACFNPEFFGSLLRTKGPEIAPPGTLENNKEPLERELRGQLNAAWTAAAQEGIANPYVTGRDNLIRAVAHFA